MKQNWHSEAFFGIHYDLHAREEDTNLGRDLTVDHLVERLSRTKPDWIQCDCKGHPGWTSWPTKTGSTSPGVVNDSVAIHREATRKLGIRLGMHYSGVIDRRAVALHPEWARIDVDGNPSARAATCPLGGYLHELMIPQLIEIIDTYDVDGFWIDGDNWASEPCWCERCTAAYKNRCGRSQAPRDPSDPHWGEWLAFNRGNFVEYVRTYTDAVHQRKPDCLVCSNWMYTARQPEAIDAPVDYLSGDYKMDWGVERSAVEGRVLDARRSSISWDLMAWGFSRPQKSEPEFGLWHHKDPLHLKQEVSEVLALGGSIMVYGKPERTGTLVNWQNEIIAEVADFCRERQALCHKTESASEAAVLHLADTYYRHNTPLFNYGSAMQRVEGALHLFEESQLSVDVILQDGIAERLSSYKVVAVPEQDVIPESVRAALETYVAEGGHLLMSGATIARDFGELVGAEPAGVPVESRDLDRVLLAAGDRAYGASGVWQPVSPVTSTEVLRYGLETQEPSTAIGDRALITRRSVAGVRGGSVTAIHGPFFNDYAARHYPTQRRLFRELIEGLEIPFTVEATEDPRLEVVARRHGDTLRVNLINRGAGETLSPTRVTVDALPPLLDVTVRIRRPVVPRTVSLDPSDQRMEWEYDDSILTVTIPRVEIHEVLTVS